MMKPLFYGILALALLLPGALSASEEGAGKAKLQQETDKLSVLLLVKQYENDFSEKSVAALDKVLYSAMLAHPADNVRVNDAKKNLSGVFTGELRKVCETELTALFQSVGKDFQALQAVVPNEELTQFYESTGRKYFEKMFAEVRKQVVAEQKEQVFRKVYPTEDEVEKLDDEALARLLEERFHAGLKAPLWEENAALARRELVEPVIQSARKQAKMQLELAQNTAVPWELWSESEIRGYLEKNILQAIGKQLEADEKCYQIFAPTREIMQTRIDAIPRERVIAAFPKKLSRTKYRELLEDDPEKHASFQQSLELVRPKMTEFLVKAAFQKSGIPAAVGEVLRQDPKFEAAAKEVFEHLSGDLKAERREFAQTQLRSYWSDLVTGEWLPELTESEEFAANGLKQIPKLRRQPKASDDLFEETKELRDERVREVLTKEVLRLEAQKKCVSEIYAKVFTEMEKHQAKLQGGEQEGFLAMIFPDANITLKGVIHRYEEMVLEKCARPLFPSVEEEIEVRSRAILMAIMEPEKQPETPEGPPKEPLRQVAIPILVAGNRGKVTVTVGSWEKRYPEEKIDFDAVAGEITKRMQQELEPAEFTVELWVKGGKIYYQTVAELQMKLESALNCKISDSLQK